MKIVNKTKLQTDQLKCFIREVAKKELIDLKDSVFAVVYRRGGRNGIAGYAYYGMPARVTLKIPRDFQTDKVELAYVVAHELAHSQGLRHKQMKNQIYSRKFANRHGLDWRQHYLWADGLPLETATVIVSALDKPSKEQVIRQKRDKCQAAMGKWESRVKRSQNRYLKWRRKFLYYESQLEKAASSPADLA